MRSCPRIPLGARAIVLACLLQGFAALRAQGVPIHDLVIDNQAVPVRLVGYGLVTGLSGTGDQTFTGRNAQHTVQSIANLLRRFDITVPPELLRTRNVAAVLVTAEVSPWLRPGGRFEVQVASVGDARSLRGGVLWMTPLIADAGGAPMATAQGPLVVDDVPLAARRRYAYVEGSGRIASGGVLEGDLPRPRTLASAKLLLRDPDAGTAARIAAVVDSVIGKGTAAVEDPGSVALTLKDGEAPSQLAIIGSLRVEPTRVGRIVIDTRQGTVVAGGELTLGPAVVSVAGITLSIGGTAADSAGAQRGALRIAAGTTVQDLAAALEAVRTPPLQVAQIFEALRQAGAIAAEIVSR
ncbi:MAG: Flagellar P-ring protein [Gemmatimonadaceae bacterium]|nr:Flagellar P-ring protein [Gemmatimonadaceae bacterium]